MTRETAMRWQQVKEILGAALELEPFERATFLARECADDQMRAEIESLLDAAAPIDADFFERGAAEIGLNEIEPPAKNRLSGRIVGAYRLLEELGAGGMGVVYLAERADQFFEQRVAVKLLRRGLDSKDAVRRFELERQILARLNHPNIARLLDGGATEDAVPFLVMEYVEGVSLTEYCRQKELSIPERIRLFKTICNCVAFAHRNLIVHRDLKPDNILVTADGVPKLLDFGIAKLLSNDSLVATRTRWQVLTPEYASPEQLCGGTITTASDVYCLGVILYELLAGQHPRKIADSSADEIINSILHEDTVPPSKAISDFGFRTSDSRNNRQSRSSQTETQTAAVKNPKSKIQNAKSLRGDLDNIVLKALSKEPARRYATVDAFCDDLRRYLEGLPVKARKPTFFYRAAKFAARNKGAAAATLLLAVSACAGIWATWWQASRAEQERRRAEQRFNDVRQLATKFVTEIHDAINETPGSTLVRETLVKRALAHLDILAREAHDDQSLQRELANAYVRVGDVQGRPNMANLGDTAGALTSYRKAAQILEKLVEGEPNNVENKRDFTKALAKLGAAQSVSSDYNAALETQRKVLSLRENLLARDPSSRENQRLVADSRRRIADALGEIWWMTGDSDKLSLQLENYFQAMQINQRLLDSNPKGFNELRALAIDNQRVGSVLIRLGKEIGDSEKFALALEHHRRALRIWIETDPNDRDGRFPAGQHKHIGTALHNLKDFAGALREFGEAQKIFERLTASDPVNAEYRRELMYLRFNMAETLAATNDCAQAAAVYREALRTAEELIAFDPARAASGYRTLATNYKAFGELLERFNDSPRARESYYKAVVYTAKWLEVVPNNQTANRLKIELDQRIAKLSPAT